MKKVYIFQEVKSSISQTFQWIGYFPQHDSLWKEIILKEYLYLNGVRNVIGLYKTL
jgi:hypothetical protein